MRALVWVYITALAYSCAPQQSSCIEVEAERWGDAFPRCSAEYAASRDPTIGFYAARAAYYLANHEEVARIAGTLIAGPRAADAEFLLGSSALARGELDWAREHLERALSMHGEASQLPEQTRDAYQLAGVWFELGEYRKALDAMQALRAAALGARDQRMQLYADVGSADLYRAIGDPIRAEEGIERALMRAQHPDDRWYARFKRGALQLDAGYYGVARESFERVLADADPRFPRYAEFLLAAHVNLAYIDRKQGRPAEALRRVEAHRDELDELTYRLHRGVILGDLGRLAEAREDLRRVEAAGPPGDWAWWVPYQAALVETRAGRTAAAIAACGRSIAKVTELAARSGTYGPKVIAKRRLPHFHLIGLYAAQRQWGKVLDIVATLDAQAMLDSSEAPADLAPSTDRALVLPAPPRGDLGDASELADAWRGRRLVVVVPGGARVWRLVLQDGALEGRELGDAARLEELARSLADRPADAVAGRALGEVLLADLPAERDPDREADRETDLLVVGPLAGAAVASLRIGDRLAISQLRIARVPGVLPRIDRPAAATAAPSLAPAPALQAVVLGDPGGDLPASAAETARVAARLGVAANVRADATRAVLAAASGADLLHVSAHTRVSFDGAALLLFDGPVDAGEIARLGPAPRRVVLASCGGSAGADDAGYGSLAHAFLGAGAEHVVATKWTIRDADAARLIAAFYEAGGDRDPVQGLAVAQRRLADELQPRTWASFEVFAARPVVP